MPQYTKVMRRHAFFLCFSSPVSSFSAESKQKKVSKHSHTFAVLIEYLANVCVVLAVRLALCFHCYSLSHTHTQIAIAWVYQRNEMTSFLFVFLVTCEYLFSRMHTKKFEWRVRLELLCHVKSNQLHWSRRAVHTLFVNTLDKSCTSMYIHDIMTPTFYHQPKTRDTTQKTLRQSRSKHQLLAQIMHGKLNSSKYHTQEKKKKKRRTNKHTAKAA